MTVNRVINMVVVALLIAILLPLGIDALVDVDTTDWPDLLVTVFDFLPILVGVAALIGIVAFIRMRGRG